MKINIVASRKVGEFGTLSAGFFASPVFENIENIPTSDLYPLAKASLQSLSVYEVDFLSKIINSRAQYTGIELAGIDLRKSLSGSTIALILKAFGNKLRSEPIREKFLVSGVIYGLILAMKEKGFAVAEAEEAKQILLEELFKIESFLLEIQKDSAE